MSSHNRNTVQGDEGRQEKQHSMVAKLAEELDGALDLRNTEDVDKDTRYAPAVTKEVVKPIVHESIEEHITRDTHTYDEYTKILPVRDVEVLPPRHWVPGPDGRLVQVDEKDVYSGAAWNQGQLGHSQTTTTTTNRADQRQESLVLGQANQHIPVTGQTQNISEHTVKHTSINPPKVVPGEVKQVYETQTIPGQVNQVYQTETHHHGAGQQQIPRKPVNEEHSTGNHIAFAQDMFDPLDQPVASEKEMNLSGPDQPHHTQPQRHPLVQQEINRYQPARGQDNTREQHSVYQTPVSQYSVPVESAPLRQAEQSPRTKDPVNQGQVQNSTTQSRGLEGHTHHRQAEQSAVDRQLYQEQGGHEGRRHTEPKHAGHQGQFMNERQTTAVSQNSPTDRDQADAHQAPVNQDQVSPGLLDPYRVKNGPVYHDEWTEAMGKPLPDLPETHEKKIAGHKILTTDDSSGHTRLHKEPKESKHGVY